MRWRRYGCRRCLQVGTARAWSRDSDDRQGGGGWWHHSARFGPRGTPEAEQGGRLLKVWLVSLLNALLSQVETKLCKISKELYLELEEMGFYTGWKQCGSVHVAQTKERLHHFRR